MTFRLRDSLTRVRREAERDGANGGRALTADRRRRRTQEVLDRGFGACWLRLPAIGAILERTLRRFDAVDYTLHGWVVMPNHVHVLVTPEEGRALSAIVEGWKSLSEKAANAWLGRSGPFWMREDLGRAIRDDRRREAALANLEADPVRAVLCRRPEDWPFSSARLRA